MRSGFDKAIQKCFEEKALPEWDFKYLSKVLYSHGSSRASLKIPLKSDGAMLVRKCYIRFQLPGSELSGGNIFPLVVFIRLREPTA